MHSFHLSSNISFPFDLSNPAADLSTPIDLLNNEDDNLIFSNKNIEIEPFSNNNLNNNLNNSLNNNIKNFFTHNHNVRIHKIYC